MIDYSKGKIYKIVCNNTGLIYIGSTCEPTLARRLAKHVINYKSYNKGKSNYITSFKIIEGGNYDIVLIEEILCETKDQLHARERYHIELNPCVNKIIPTRTEKEYKKLYYKEHKEEIKIKHNIYQQEHKEEIKEKQSIYRQEHKDELKAKQTLYRQEHKEEIKGYKAILYTCECGRSLRINDKARHQRTKKHQKYLKSKDEIILNDS